MSGLKRNQSVAFIIRTDGGSQGICVMDVQEALARASGYSREQVEVKEIPANGAIAHMVKAMPSQSA